MDITIYTPIKPFETSEELSVVVATQNRPDSVLFRELADLLDTLGYHVLKVFYQNSSKRNPRYFMGKGKLGEIADYLKTASADLVIIDHNLKPIQIFNAQEILRTDVFDRVRVILEIFVRNARSMEAKLQVELASLRYEIPLVREWIHQSKTGEHPGFRTGGEFQVSQYLDGINNRSRRIEEKLGRIKAARQLRRERKRGRGSYNVALAGYTNAGKTSLLNALSDEEGDVKDRFFTTLSTRTRRMNRGGLPILITDTIGFIQYMPPYLVQAFRSTLEEIFFSDVIVLVVDVSDDMKEIYRKMITSFDILLRERDGPPIICAFNKTDLLERKEAEAKIHEIKTRLGEAGYPMEGSIHCSASEGRNLEDMADSIRNALPDMAELILVVHDIVMHRSLESEIRERFEVLGANSHDGNENGGMAFRVRGSRIDMERFAAEHADRVELLGGDR